MLTPDTPVKLAFNREEIPARKEIFNGMSKTFHVRWSPQVGDISPEIRATGLLTFPVTILLTYQENGKEIHLSKTTDVRIKLDTTRLRRRLDSKLDLLMGKVPDELKG